MMHYYYNSDLLYQLIFENSLIPYKVHQNDKEIKQEKMDLMKRKRKDHKIRVHLTFGELEKVFKVLIMI